MADAKVLIGFTCGEAAALFVAVRRATFVSGDFLTCFVPRLAEVVDDFRGADLVRDSVDEDFEFDFAFEPPVEDFLFDVVFDFAMRDFILSIGRTYFNQWVKFVLFGVL